MLRDLGTKKHLVDVLEDNPDIKDIPEEIRKDKVVVSNEVFDYASDEIWDNKTIGND